MPSPFTLKVIAIIEQIPPGKVSTYGVIAECAGNHRGAREVARILHSSSDKYNLPWHRVVNRLGKISLKPFSGYEEQRQLLEEEGIYFDKNDKIELESYLWWPDQSLQVRYPQ
jgi:methylated-DNA-protein-cysteine methyltransferase-like protein